jgi:hypothetical protein
LNKWFGNKGLTIISFPIEAEYTVLKQIHDGIGEESRVIIHSKPLDDMKNTMLIDATRHEPTARIALRQRVSDQDSENFLENPADVEGVLNRLGKLGESIKADWWLWWSPSDMIAQGVADDAISRCLRIVAKDFSKVRFLAFVAKGVHSERGLATLKYISAVYVDIIRESDNGKFKHRWHLLKHPTITMEGEIIETD